MGDRRAIVNASPLIFLARAGRLDLFKGVAEEVLVPAAVADEIGRRGASVPTVLALHATEWLRVEPARDVDLRVLAWDLGPGESAVLSLAIALPGHEVIIDDLAGRRCAQALGVPVRGTLGLVLLAKRTGRITAARPVVDHLRQMGMFLSDNVVDRALALVDE